jgi:hypothetical protein
MTLACWILGWLWQLFLHLVDCCIPADVDVHGGATESLHDRIRYHPVSPADRIWMDRDLDETSGSAARPSSSAVHDSPGTSASSIVHAVLIFDRRISLPALQDAIATRLLTPSTFARFLWRVVRITRTRRWLPRCLPGWFGGSSEEYAWMEEQPSRFALARHVRSVRSEEWSGYGVRDDKRGEGIQMRESSVMVPSSGEASDLESATSSSPAPDIDHTAAIQTAQLQSYLSHLASTPLAPHQPLWELLLLEPPQRQSAVRLGDFYGQPIVDERDQESVAIFRCSHAVADGVLMSGIILKTFLQEGARIASTSDDAASCVTPSREPRKQRSCTDHLVAALQQAYIFVLFILCGPYLLFHKSFQPDGDNVLHVPSSSSKQPSRKEICWSSTPFPLAQVKTVSKALNVTLNDLVMNLWLEVIDEYLIATEQYLQTKRNRSTTPGRIPDSQHAPSSLFVLVPFNVRSPKDFDLRPGRTVELGNKFAVLFVDAPMGRGVRGKEEEQKVRPSKERYQPIDTGGASTSSRSSLISPFLRRLAHLSGYMSQLKARPFEPLLMYYGVSFLLRFLPAALSSYVLDIYSDLCSIVITNNRSTDGPLYLATSPEFERESELARVASPSSASSAAVVPSILDSRPRLKLWISFAPQRSRIGICVTILTYDGQLRVSIVADERSLRHTSCAALVQRYQEKLTQLTAEVEVAQAAEAQ